MTSAIRGSRGKYPYDEGRHLLVIIDLYAYGDESGLQDRPPYCLLAGYIASPNQWRLFNHDWQEILKAYGVPLFHAKEFFPFQARSHNPVYKGWQTEKAKTFVFSLGEAINNHAIHPLGCAIDVKAFESFSIGERRFLTGAGWNSQTGTFKYLGKPASPYLAVFESFVRAALDRTPPKARLHLVFHSQREMEPKVCEIFADMITNSHLMPRGKRPESIGYRSADNSPELQACDLYAYGWNYYLSHKSSGWASNYLLRVAMTQLCRKVKGIDLMDRDSIEATLTTGLQPNDRERIRQQL
jgi:hypothetical protein